MLHTSPVIAFSATRDPERARAFYADKLGLKFVADEHFALVFEANGTMLRIQKAPSYTPLPFTQLGWQVANIERTVDVLSERGVVFERFDGFEQDERGVWTAPDGARVAWFKDPDGNLLSLTSF
jgi:catechol 2,3-dioxygenase-like lactoylglutathione lyase family enzyme